jgi:hypothetical protein
MPKKRSANDQRQMMEKRKRKDDRQLLDISAITRRDRTMLAFFTRHFGSYLPHCGSFSVMTASPTESRIVNSCLRIASIPRQLISVNEVTTPETLWRRMAGV